MPCTRICASSLVDKVLAWLADTVVPARRAVDDVVMSFAATSVGGADVFAKTARANRTG